MVVGPISLRSGARPVSVSKWRRTKRRVGRGGEWREGAFWGVDNSERVAIKGRIAWREEGSAKLRTCLSTDTYS